MLKYNTESFREEFKKRYGDKYDLSGFEYKGVTVKSTAICPFHGSFFITPRALLNGNGCKECAKLAISKKNASTQEEIINKIKAVHGDYYDLSQVEYKGIFEKITLICPKHGPFQIRPHNIICNKQGCKKCGYENSAKKQTGNLKSFIEKANIVHNSKYDYSKSVYVNNSTDLCIICHEIDPITHKEHGEFWKRPSYHLDGIGCPKCTNKNFYSVEEFIEKANIVHNNKYIYTNLPEKIENHSDKLEIICPKHGIFKIKPYVHLYQKVGCPLCKESKLEKEIAGLLDEYNIIYERQKSFKWLKRNGKNHHQTLDFYLPEYNIAIECQGEEHFKENEFFGDFSDILDRDLNKYLKCNKHNIEILYYSDKKYDAPFYDLITDKNVLIESINKDCEH